MDIENKKLFCACPNLGDRKLVKLFKNVLNYVCWSTKNTI